MAAVLVFKCLEVVAIAFPFILLGAMARGERGTTGRSTYQPRRIVAHALAWLLGSAMLLPALQSERPGQPAYVLGGIVVGFALGFALSQRRRLLRLQPLLCSLGALIWVLGQAYESCVSAADPERYRKAYVSAAVYSAVNLAEVLVVFLLVLGIMKLLKRPNTGLALILALCALALDSDIRFLWNAALPVAFAALTGDLAQRAGLAPADLLEVVAQRLKNHPRVAHWIGRPGPGRPAFLRRAAAVLAPALAIAVFVTDYNYIWAMWMMAEGLDVTFPAPFGSGGAGAEWSYSFAMLAVAAVPLGASIRALLAPTGVEKAKINATS